MIQRIQSLYLLLAAVCAVLTLFVTPVLLDMPDELTLRSIYHLDMSVWGLYVIAIAIALLAIVDIFPKIRRNMNGIREDVCFCPDGLRFSNPGMMLQKEDYLIADGFDKINSVLNMEEFGLLNSFSLIQLFPCFNGCIGGHLLFGNSFITKNNLHALTSEQSKPAADLSFEEIYSNDVFVHNEDTRTFMERVEWFNTVNAQLELLPGYDCSACGMQTCRLMAEEIAEGHKSLKDCRVLAAMEEKITNEDQ